MTQKYKKNNSPTIQNSIFPSFPDVFQTILSGFPDVFWFRYGAICLAFQKNMGDLGSEVAHTGYVENISCFRG